MNKQTIQVLAMLAAMSPMPAVVSVKAKQQKQPKQGEAVRSTPKLVPPKHARIKAGQRAARRKKNR